ncbi:uncharacterized protein LOC135634978 [Musa acuminata AAA Group]|uniref:uncharacterized protein LOC135634978 n=1 Tax=Musa acuminata AAA Group TaxID=214697 RepID=UPI0031D084B1
MNARSQQPARDLLLPASFMFIDGVSRHAVVSWSLFLLLGVFILIASHFVLSCALTRCAYDVVVQLSLTSSSGLSYLCLFAFVHHFLFLDKLVRESKRVREGYMDQLNRSFRLLFIFVMSCFAGEMAYKVWWHSSGSEQVLFAVAGSRVVGNMVACALELASDIRKLLSSSLVRERLHA